MTPRKETPIDSRQDVINMRENGMRGTKIAMEMETSDGPLISLIHEQMQMEPFETLNISFVDENKPKKIIKMWMILAAICIFGIVLNLALLIRRKFIARRSSSTTRSSLFLLGTMAAADTVCLFSLLFLLCLRFFALEQYPNQLTVICKLNVFVMHTTSSFSIWCWLVLSAVRYMAVYKPYTHLKLNKEPTMAVIFVAIFCCFTELWVLWDIEYNETFKSCVGPDTETSRKLQISEIIISYFLPVAFITVLDLKVILCRAWRAQSPKSSVKSVQNPPSLFHQGIIEAPETLIRLTRGKSTNEMRCSAKYRKRQQLKVLRRCLCITVFDLLMNLPSYLLRLYLNLIPADAESDLFDWQTMVFIEEVSQILYFAQFALNAVYLGCIIYDNPKARRKDQSVTRLSSMGITSKPSCRKTTKESNFNDII